MSPSTRREADPHVSEEKAGAPPDLDQILDLALRSARSAGQLLLDGRPATLVHDTKSSPTDVVTQMDRASEELLVGMLLTERPRDGVLGEEGGERSGTSGLRWILDPVDGTTNYVYSLPQWAVSVAAEWQGDIVVGVVEAPALGRRYWASKDRGAWEESTVAGFGHEKPRRLHVTEPPSLAQSLVSTGFGYASEQRARQAEDLRSLAPLVRDIRRMGAAAIDLAWVAAGHVDAYFESGLKEWDLAAGGLIAREAGAVVEGLHGAPASGDFAIAAAPAIFTALHDVLTAG